MDDKIIIIAPYPELSAIANKVVKNIGMSIETVSGELREGVMIAEMARKRGKEIVISRGGTAQVIREQVGLPVIEIEVSGYDLLRAIYKQKDNLARTAVAGYTNVINGAKTIADILGLTMSYIYIEKEEESKDKINEAVKAGIRFFIGDTISVKIAENMGLGYELIKSGEESVLDAIYRARDLYTHIVNERGQKELLKAVLDSSNEGIIAVDDDSKITLINKVAGRIFGLDPNFVVNKRIDAVIPDVGLESFVKMGDKELGLIKHIGKTRIATNKIPIKFNNNVMGAIIKFQNVTDIIELEQRIRQEIFLKGLSAKYTFKDIIGNSEAIKKAVSLAKKYGAVDSTVLILGESGTGKELFAQSMHNISRRKHKPFVAINCAALPSELLESELFGYEEGSFTGARKGGKKGLFELAHNGTIFLDEVGEMDLRVQARILRVIQEKEVMRIGSDKVIPVDVRIIAATNRILQDDVDKGRFRQDLFYRLNVLSITIPPLRYRIEDIELLTLFFANLFYQKHRIKPQSVEKSVIDILKKHNWLGNVRELQNVVEKLVVISDGRPINKEVLEAIDFPPSPQAEVHEKDTLEGTLDEIINKAIERVLREENYNKSRAANRLGIDRATLQRRLAMKKN